MNLSTNEEVGLLVEGHDTPPMFMMGHDAPHTPARIEGAGYAKAKDIYAYVCSVADDLPPSILRRVRKPAAEGVVLRTVNMKRFDEEVRTLTTILNDAWSGNWGFTPTTEAVSIEATPTKSETRVP